MGLFGNKKMQQELEQLRARNAYLEANLTPNMQETDQVAARLEHMKQEVAEFEQNASQWDEYIGKLEAKSKALETEIATRKNEVVDLDSILSAQDYGLYKPRFAFANSTQYRDALKEVRDEQKALIKHINEQAKKTTWSVNGSKTEGKKMVADITKLLIRGFNSECDDLVAKVRTSNIDRSIERIRKSAESISKLGRVIGLSIPEQYIHLKEKEARLGYEFAMAKEKEKEEIRAAREREREEAKVRKEIEERRKRLKKERKQYADALEALKKQAETSGMTDDIEKKMAELSENLSEVDTGIADVDYREANQKAGYVYVISNIGSFGEGIYKIGMTRRLDPMERVKELGDASVPFEFDVHALIFTDDAPGLEAALHREFSDRRVNMVNNRREFFRVSLEEIEQVVMANYDKTVEFTEAPDAAQYRTSEAMRREMQQKEEA